MRHALHQSVVAFLLLIFCIVADDFTAPQKFNAPLSRDAFMPLMKPLPHPPLSPLSTPLLRTLTSPFRVPLIYVQLAKGYEA